MINLTLTTLQAEALENALTYYLWACKQDDRFMDHIVQIDQIKQQIERLKDALEL